jgi:phage-related minor tail protein
MNGDDIIGFPTVFSMANGIGLMGEAGRNLGGEVNDGGSVDYDFDAELR